MDRLACIDLHAGIPIVAPAADVVMERLRGFSPRVERARELEGVFWLDARGLGRLYPSLEKWAKCILADLKTLGFEAAAVVGFTRFGTFALARSGRGIVVLPDDEAEISACGRVPLGCLGISASALRNLSRLGKRTVADLLSLPAGGLTERFGEELRTLHRLASRAAWDPLTPDEEIPAIAERIDLDYPEADATRLTFYIKRLLRPLLDRVAGRCHALKSLTLALALHHHPPSVHRIAPAEPTLDEMQLIDLVRLRLENLSLPVGAVAVTLEAATVPATTAQLELFQKKPRRDIKAADRALARLAAELGEGAVVRATLTRGHLPEARFVLEPLRHVRSPKRDIPGESRTSDPPLIRRIFTKPRPLQKRPVVGPRGCHLKGLSHAPATRVTGPYVISGGWWIREVHREYYFAETEAGEILWVYYDKRRRSWFLHGEVQ